MNKGPLQRECSKFATDILLRYEAEIREKLDKAGAPKEKIVVAIMRAFMARRRELILEFNKIMDDKNLWNEDGTHKPDEDWRGNEI